MTHKLLSALTVSALLAAPALAGHPPGAPPSHGEFRGGHPGEGGDGAHGGDPAEIGARLAEHQSARLSRALDLTDAQKTSLAALQGDLGDTLRPLFASMRTTHEALQNALEAAQPDPVAVGNQAIALHQAKSAMKAAHDSFEAGIEAMLTDVQRAQYQALQDARPDRERSRGRRALRERHGSR